MIPAPSIDEQRAIAGQLNKASEIITERKRQLEKLDLLVKARFIEMFGDPESNQARWKKQKWEDVFNTTTGKIDSNAMVAGGRYPFFTCAKEIFQIDDFAFDCEALLLAGNNAAGIYDVKHYKGKFNAYQRTYVITHKNPDYSYYPFKMMIEDKLERMRELSKGTNTKYLTLGILSDFDFVIPPLPLQHRFADFVHATDRVKSDISRSLEELELLYNALMQNYFGNTD
jgi:restriction endonuclease S subunit